MGKRIEVLVVRPSEAPKMESIEDSLERYYEVMDCDCIQAVYPFDDKAALVCDDEGKFRQKPNRALFTKDGEIADVVYGTFLICGIKGADFVSLTKEQADKYMKMFRYPEHFMNIGGSIIRVLEGGDM